MTGRPSWDQAGLTNGTGSLDRPLAAGRLFVPAAIEVDAENDRLLWAAETSPTSRGHERRPGPGLLNDFVELHDASAQRVRGYARRWGVLQICARHRPLPSSHNPPPENAGGARDVYWCAPCGYYTDRVPDWDGWELLADWRWWSGQAQALLNIAARLHEGEPGRVEDWQRVYERQPRVDPKRWKRHVAGRAASSQRARYAAVVVRGERQQLARVLNEWALLGNVRPRFSWSSGGPSIELRADLFGLIALQLLQAVAKTVGLAVCSGCGEGYGLTQRPREGERRYCGGCRERGVPMRDAVADYRRRLRDKAEQRGARGGKTRKR